MCKTTIQYIPRYINTTCRMALCTCMRLNYGQRIKTNSKPMANAASKNAQLTSEVVESGLHVEAKEEVLPQSWSTSVLETGHWACGDNPHLVEAHDLNHPRLEVENLLVANAHACLLCRKGMRSVSAWRFGDVSQQGPQGRRGKTGSRNGRKWDIRRWLPSA